MNITTTPLSLRYIELDVVAHPFYDSRYSATNWVAVMTGKNSVVATRSFLRSRGDRIDTTETRLGDVLEIGSNYIKRYVKRTRRYYLVTNKADCGLLLTECETLAQALKTANAVTIKDKDMGTTTPAEILLDQFPTDAPTHGSPPYGLCNH